MEGQLAYEGEWRDNIMEGWGVFYACGEQGQSQRIVRYEGQFRNNKRNGFGRLHLADGQVFEGQFRDNRIQGTGLTPAAS